MDKSIELTIPEFDLAVNTARLRMIASASLRLNHASTYDRNLLKRLEQETVGACGEIAVAKLFGAWFVPSVNTFHRTPDCLQDVEVRSTHHENGCLVVRRNDHNQRRFICCIVSAPTVRFAGWLYGHQAKKDEFLKNPGNMREEWFVPQQYLSSMDEMNEFLVDF